MQILPLDWLPWSQHKAQIVSELTNKPYILDTGTQQMVQGKVRGEMPDRKPVPLTMLHRSGFPACQQAAKLRLSALISQLSSKAGRQRSPFFFFFLMEEIRSYQADVYLCATISVLELCWLLWDWSRLPGSVVPYEQTILCPYSKLFSWPTWHLMNILTVPHRSEGRILSQHWDTTTTDLQYFLWVGW